MIPLFKVYMDDSVETEVPKTLLSGMITQSTKVEEFEKELKIVMDHPYILTLNSATSGLTLGLRLLDLSPGDEVLCTPMTCFATTASVLANNLSIKWVDVDPSTCNMDLDDLKNKITSKTKAILCVHWGGSPIDIDRLKHIACDIPIVEDCAHAWGSRYKNRHVGTTGNIGVFSFQAIKHLTTGDGGLISLPTKELYDRAKKLRWYGIDRDERSKGDFRLEKSITEWGYKFHMNDIDATIGLCNLDGSLENVKRHMDNASFYTKELSDIKGVECVKKIPNSESSFWIFSIKIKGKNGFIKWMKSKDVMVSQVHKRNDLNKCTEQFSDTTLVNTSRLEKELVCIPCGWWVSDNDRCRIVYLIREWCDMYLQLKIKKLTPDRLHEYVDLLSHFNTADYLDCKNSIVYDEIWCAVLNNKIVASSKLLIEDKIFRRVGHIEDVIVHPDYRGMGFGKQIVTHAINESQRLNCYKAVLTCAYRLSDFYTSCGMENKELGFEIRFPIQKRKREE